MAFPPCLHPATPAPQAVHLASVPEVRVRVSVSPSPPSLKRLTSLLYELLAATGVPDMQAPSLGVAADAGAHTALPGAPSFLDELLVATGIPDKPRPYTWASVVTAQQPALTSTPSLLKETLAATGILDMPGPSLGPSANARAWAHGSQASGVLKEASFVHFAPLAHTLHLLSLFCDDGVC